MDDLWERSVPFYEVSYNKIKNIFVEYKQDIRIESFSPINIGCRNSNYCIETNKGKYLLRICSFGSTEYLKERLICDALQGDVKLPELLYISENNVADRICLIYEFIDAVCLQTAFANGRMLNKNIIQQIAGYAAIIHNTCSLNHEDLVL